MTTEIKNTTKEMEVSLKLDYKGSEIIIDEARKLKAENNELKAKLEIHEESIKHLLNWLIEIGELIGIDIQRDFNGEFNEEFIEEVYNCTEDQLAVNEFDLERQDKIIEAQKESIEANKKNR
ncbi:hypothetical protein [Bacillus clarus]|uniref:Uncharacterized protein n=1 Tax=Bacillus clarus TaxID=2338372 RepID=A0A090Z289_9BACI|nr:hypothetical protein [Bacillus clarus]KFN04285.1 hypothetical protein DJ93_1166 [Bacillus clarus]